MKLKNYLKKVDENRIVNVTFYAYGIYYANTMVDGLNTCKEVLKGVKSWLLDSFVLEAGHHEGQNTLFISCEICK